VGSVGVGATTAGGSGAGGGCRLRQREIRPAARTPQRPRGPGQQPVGHVILGTTGWAGDPHAIHINPRASLGKQRLRCRAGAGTTGHGPIQPRGPGLP
jgi:hypothetical protein